MKVLMFAAYFYDGKHAEFSRNKTGYGLLIPEIAMSVGGVQEVYLDTYMPTKGFDMKSSYGKCTVLKHGFGAMLLASFWGGIVLGLQMFLKQGQSLKNRFHNCYYGLNYGMAKRAIKKVRPDIVHIHDIHTPFIRACEKLKVPYIVSLHGLNGFLENVDDNIKKEEREFLCRAQREGIPVTVISTGIKKRIEKEYYAGEIGESISVVTNGTNLKRQNAYTTTRGEERKIVTAVGNLCERKNQKQIIEAIHYLNKDFDGYQLYLCGKDTLNGELKVDVEKYQLEDKVFFLGFVAPEKVDELLEEAVLNILASKDEGFGISMIEAFVHGVPTVTFSDLDAVEDVYSEDAMLLCESRDTKAFAKAIKTALKKEWNKEAIKEHAVKFSLECMAQQYVEKYESVLTE